MRSCIEQRLNGVLVNIYLWCIYVVDKQNILALNIANYRTVKIWKLKQADYEGVREWKIAQKDAEKALISRLESDVTNTKSAPVAVSTSYRTLPLRNNS